MIRFIKTFYRLINILIIIALLVIHFIIKENSYNSSLLFYTFPLPVIIIGILLLSIFLSKKARKWNLILAFVLLVIWFGRSFKINSADKIIETDIEIVFWNASHDRNFDEAFKENKGVPDILVLAEHGDFQINTFKLKYPVYHFYRSIRGISIFSKSEIKILDETTSKYKTNIINFETYNLNVFAIDVSASMDVPRSWELGFVNSIIKEGKNTVLLGDFNVPLESKYFDDIKINFSHAFAEKGNGLQETWFWNIPLLSLDHIWVSKDLEILKTEKINTFKSDHSMIKTYIRK
ncbi:MAG: endonuclease/exonuclease/phosphatase family protein [Algibacter sp.]